MRRAVLLASVAACFGCELSETTLAEPEDVVIAEIVLRAGDAEQVAMLHRTLGPSASRTVEGAVIEVSDRSGLVMAFEPAPLSLCFDSPDAEPGSASCYRSLAAAFGISAGETYTLRIRLPEGGILTGVTTVPGDFEILRPAVRVCRLAPEQPLDLAWTAAAGAWVYVAEASLRGLAAALEPLGIELHQEPVRLLGLAVTREDTTITFPTGFGLFDRADPALSEALIAIRDGLPPTVLADVVVAAADRNYVNWVRGGNFNPSGSVRVPSVEGPGTGVFGSIVPKRRAITTSLIDPAPPCL